MLASEGGGLIGGLTEKHRPWAWPSSWYGSWPSSSTLTLSYGVSSKALKTSSSGGKTLCLARSPSTNFISSWKYGFSNSSPRTLVQEEGSLGFFIRRLPRRSRRRSSD